MFIFPLEWIIYKATLWLLQVGFSVQYPLRYQRLTFVSVCKNQISLNCCIIFHTAKKNAIFPEMWSNFLLFLMYFFIQNSNFPSKISWEWHTQIPHIFEPWSFNETNKFCHIWMFLESLWESILWLLSKVKSWGTLEVLHCTIVGGTSEVETLQQAVATVVL